MERAQNDIQKCILVSVQFYFLGRYQSWPRDNNKTCKSFCDMQKKTKMLSALCRNGGATTCEVTWQQDAICRGHVVTSAQLRTQHRRRMGTEEKAKVVASVWGTEFVQFLATLAVLPWSF